MVTQSLVSISPFRNYFQRCVIESITTIPVYLESGMKLELNGSLVEQAPTTMIPVAALVFRLD